MLIQRLEHCFMIVIWCGFFLVTNVLILSYFGQKCLLITLNVNVILPTNQPNSQYTNKQLDRENLTEGRDF